jgi:hypothetical protein
LVIGEGVLVNLELGQWGCKMERGFPRGIVWKTKEKTCAFRGRLDIGRVKVQKTRGHISCEGY